MIMALLVIPAWAQGFETEGEKEASGSEISSGGDTGGEKEEGGNRKPRLSAICDKQWLANL